MYACGFAISFVILEVGSIADDIQDIGMLFNGEIIAFVLNFIIDSFQNTWKALAWPAYVVQFNMPWGAVALGLAFWLFPSTLKKPIQAWLFRDDEQEEPAGADSPDREKKENSGSE